MGQAQRNDPEDARTSEVPSAPDDGTGAANDDLVRCMMSGDYIARTDAVMVTLGPGRRRWVRRDLTNAGR